MLLFNVLNRPNSVDVADVADDLISLFTWDNALLVKALDRVDGTKALLLRSAAVKKRDRLNLLFMVFDV